MSDTEQVLRPEVIRENAPPPKKYGVFLLNDDYTPMDFVVGLLADVFRLPENRAEAVMLQVHHEGKGLCGVYQKDIADTKHQQVQNLARQAGHPLLSTVEEV